MSAAQKAIEEMVRMKDRAIARAREVALDSLLVPECERKQKEDEALRSYHRAEVIEEMIQIIQSKNLS
jgi:hypothetical protein